MGAKVDLQTLSPKSMGTPEVSHPNPRGCDPLKRGKKNNSASVSVFVSPKKQAKQTPKKKRFMLTMTKLLGSTRAHQTTMNQSGSGRPRSGRLSRGCASFVTVFGGGCV